MSMAWASDGAMKALVIAGQDDHHWWKGSSDAVKQILKNSGKFTVTVLSVPNGDNIENYHPDFDKYDLVILLYGGKTWQPDTQKKFEKYIAGGHGLIVLHSSIVPMQDWPEYNKMIGLGAWNGRDEKWGPYVYWKDGHIVYDFRPGEAGHHSLQHPFIVMNKDTMHPIMRGLPLEWLHYKDEVYSKLRGPAINMHILATTFDSLSLGGSGREEPVLWTVNYGKGRVFVSLLGHVGNDPELRYAMTYTDFQVLLLRACEWVVKGEVTQMVAEDFPGKDFFSLRTGFKPPVQIINK